MQNAGANAHKQKLTRNILYFNFTYCQMSLHVHVILFFFLFNK